MGSKTTSNAKQSRKQILRVPEAELELKNNELKAQMVEVIAMNNKLAARVRELEGAAKASTEAPVRGKEGLAAETNALRALNASDYSMATAVGSLRGGRQLSHAEMGSDVAFLAATFFSDTVADSFATLSSISLSLFLFICSSLTFS